MRTILLAIRIAGFVVLGLPIALATPVHRGPARIANPFLDRAKPLLEKMQIDQSRIEFKQNQLFCRLEGVPLYLDVVLPKPATQDRPAILFIHGGGFYSGHRDDLKPLAMLAADRGFVGITVDYRLAGLPGEDEVQKNDPHQVMSTFPAGIEDVRCAVRWLRQNAAELGILPERIGAMGVSYGAYFALMLGLSPTSPKLERQGDLSIDARAKQDNVQAVVNWFGPSSMASQYWFERSPQSLGAPITSRYLGGAKPYAFRKFFLEASPISFVRPSSAPTLTIHGTKDRVVPFEQSVALDKAMSKEDAFHQLIPIPGVGHGLLDPQAQLSKKVFMEQIETTFYFFNKTLGTK